jgi:hypothetical protein
MRLKEYTPASIAQWRKADKWDEEGDKHVTNGGQTLSPIISVQGEGGFGRAQGQTNLADLAR